jgi:hypothetical protein
LDYDRAVGIHNPYPGGGGYTGMVFDIAYARAMFQASIMLERGTEWKEFQFWRPISKALLARA